MAISIVATIWLALTGQLVLYIHPRYVVFTVVMAVLGLVFVLASIARRADPDGDDEHDHEHAERRSRRLAVLSGTATVVALTVAGTLLVLPPTTLSSATAQQRDINSTGVGAGTRDVDEAAASSDGAFAKFTVLDWASLLRQTSDSSFYDGKPADVIGFITADEDDPDNMFYLTRFVVTCCAVDAQPVGVPVYLPDWKTSFSADEWVQVNGGFVTNPSDRSGEAIALIPDDIAEVEQPSEPYLF